ncbi:hypothetical protein NDU88_010576 [Pleurodeles waltl]|uniref:Uncharacterized protein n=1 Tax=Pleurodeles waltl TaxID=8319 RepID=A0AAV7PZ59_PLEWA|nr:hypothetical protein NDU88_010576 [Pleurodeles waltl]
MPQLHFCARFCSFRGFPVLQCARRYPHFNLLGNPPSAHPQGAIHHSPVPSVDPTASLAWSWQLDPPAPDIRSAPWGPGSTRSRATQLWYPTRVDHLSRNNLASVCWGSPGPAVLCSFRFFGVCQGPEPHLKSSGLTVCPRSASSAGPPCPNRPLRHSKEIPPASPAIFGPLSHLGPQPSPEAQPRSRARPRALPGPPASGGASSSHPDWARPYLGSQAPLRHLRCRWGAHPASPAAQSRPPSRRFGSRLHTRPRLRPRAQASGFHFLRRADSGTLRGRRGSPPTLGPLRRLRPTAWTSIGLGKVRFRTFTRRPLRSERFRRALLLMI